MRTVLLTLVITIGYGCGGEEGSVTGWEGIYLLSDWTNNGSSCDAEGQSVLVDKSETALFVRSDELFGQRFVTVATCLDVQACRDMASDQDTLFLDAFMFTEGNDHLGRTGQTVWATSGEGDDCAGSVAEHTLEEVGDGIVQVQTRVRFAAPYARDSDGFCTTDEASVAASDQPCSEYEVITAEYERPL